MLRVNMIISHGRSEGLRPPISQGSFWRFIRGSEAGANRILNGKRPFIGETSIFQISPLADLHYSLTNLWSILIFEVIKGIF